MGLIPRFASPEPPSDPDPMPMPVDSGPSPSGPPRTLRERLLNRQPGPPTDTRTPISSGGDNPAPAATLKDLTAALAGVVGLVVAVAAFGVRARAQGQRELRRPTDDQLADIAAPIARIAKRHADVAWLNPDLLDVLAAGNAVGTYVNSGPLTRPIVPDAGMPADLQENPS